MEQVVEWQNRLLDTIYPIVYLDCIVLKVRQDSRVINKNAVYPETRIQLCIVHMVRNSLRFVSWKDYKAVTSDLKTIYQAPWDNRYPQISRSGESNWTNFATFMVRRLNRLF